MATIVGWLLAGIVLLLMAGAGFWVWAIRTQSVATLDRIDAFYTSGKVEQSAPVAYGSLPNQKVVVARPLGQAARPRPVVVFVHGGSWAKGDAADYAYVARNLAAEGYVAVSAGYRLVPGGEFPAMLQDGARALRWVSESIGAYGGDPQRIYLMGHSAGAYNIAMLALDPRWLESEGLPRSLIKGAIGLAGPYDFLPLDSESTRNAFGGAKDLRETQPVSFAGADAPPMLLITGDADQTVRPRNSRALADALTRAGQATEPVLVPGMTHGGIVMALSRPFAGDGTVKAAILEFLAAQEAAAPATSSAAIQPGGG